MKAPPLKSLGGILGILLIGSPLWAAGVTPFSCPSWTAGGTFFLGSPLRSSGFTPCVSSAQNTYKSCQLGANDDYYLALALCQNLASARDQLACAKQAAQDAKDALGECADQNAARLEVCQELGGAAYHPAIDPANFVSGVDNPYFPLTPGTTLVYLSQTPDGLERDEVQVTHDTKMILGVPCVVVHDRVTRDGELLEDTLDWYTQDKAGNVWYFGEEAKQYEDGELVSIDGSWKAGRDGAQPGIIMEADPKVGDLYRQEFLPKEAEDLGRVASLDASAVVPYNSFTGLLETDDFSPLEPDIVEQKFYAAGIGTVLEIDADGVRNELAEIITE